MGPRPGALDIRFRPVRGESRRSCPRMQARAFTRIDGKTAPLPRRGVPKGGIEPPRPRGHRILSPVRLPVPPLRPGCAIVPPVSAHGAAAGISIARRTNRTRRERRRRGGEMRIGILTGGGDVPGLNPCIKAVVNRVAHEGHEVVGLRRGWAALLEHDPDDPASARAVVPAARARTSSARSTAPAARSCTPRARTRAACGRRTCPPHLAAPQRRRRARSTSPITRCA